MIKDTPEGQTQYCQSCQELAAQVEVMQDALNVIAMLGTTDGDRRAASATLPPNCIAADILRQRDMQTLLDTVEKLKSLERSTASWNNSIRTAITEVQNMTYILEK